MKYISKKKLLRLVINSKELQKKLDITIKNYIEFYLNKFVTTNNVFMYTYNNPPWYDENNKNKTKELYLKDLSKSKCDEKIFESFSIDKLREMFMLYPKNYSYPIDFNSPLFIPILKAELIEYFEIIIIDEIYRNNTLLNDLYNIFKSLDEQNLKYPKISIYITHQYLSLLEHLQLNFNKVEKLKVNIHFTLSLPGEPVYSDDDYLKYIFSFVNEKQNLKKFELNVFKPLKAETLDILKIFPNLKSLFIIGCPFENIFNLTLNNLEEVSFIICKNCF